MKKNPRITIIGAGNGGLSTAGDLGSRGFEICLYDKFPEPLAPVLEKQGIEMIGKLVNGFTAIHHITQDLGESVEFADIIFVITTANAHQDVAESLSKFITRGQTVVLVPGYFGGSIIFKNEFEKAGIEGVDILELRLLPYAARLVAPATVGIKGIKKVVHCAALPASRTEKVLELMIPVIPFLRPMSNILEVGINNTNPLAHVPLALLGMTRMENEEQNEHFDYDSWNSPASKRLQLKLDEERLKIVEVFGFSKITRKEWSEISYSEKREIYKRKGKIPESSLSVPPRYITEDIPYGLVPISDLGHQFNVATPVCDAVIEIASAAKGINFRNQGRTLDKLGLNGMQAREMINKVG